MRLSGITKKYYKDGKLLTGFTIIELVVTISIFTILVFGASVMLTNIFSNSQWYTASITNIDQINSAMSVFTNEIRDATAGSDGSYAITEASDFEIVFYSNFGGDNSVVKRIRYFISEGKLYKGVVIPSGNPLSYNLSNESTSALITGIANGSSPAFYYYNGDYDGAQSALSQPININQIRFVEISLLVPNRINASDTSTFSVSAGATIRALKDNLGN